jgi:hypothetical protein
MYAVLVSACIRAVTGRTEEVGVCQWTQLQHFTNPLDGGTAGPSFRLQQQTCQHYLQLVARLRCDS